MRLNFQRTRLFLEAAEDNVLFARFLQPNIWTSPLDPLSQRGAYLRLAVLWAKADSIIGRLLDGGDAENQTVEALKDEGVKKEAPTFLPEVM